MGTLLIYEILIWVLLLCCFLCLYRIGRGPSAPDRTVAIDILGIVVVGFCALLALIAAKDFYMNVAIAWSLLSFIGTIALAKHIEGRGFDE
ncbi:MAG: multiple resistance and pH regulation protein F [Candidatus Latescibacteria bacterium]|nr:multiple resistance and pH regulation protein F [Candidatus Latescibacterota bacterium]